MNKITFLIFLPPVPLVTENLVYKKQVMEFKFLVDNGKKSVMINKYTTQVCGCKSMPVAGKAIHVSNGIHCEHGAA